MDGATVCPFSGFVDDKRKYRMLLGLESAGGADRFFSSTVVFGNKNLQTSASHICEALRQI